MAKQIHVTAQDRHRLLNYLEALKRDPDKRDLPHIKYLENEIARAHVILDLYKTPGDMVTMRSQVLLKNMSTQEEFLCALVYPSEQAPETGRISVLTPLGAAMLGYRVGDTFEAELPKGRTQFLVKAIAYQPESAGDHDL